MALVGAGAFWHQDPFQNVSAQGYLILHFKHGWKRVTFPATYMGVKTRPAGLITIGGHPHTPLERGCQRAIDLTA